MTEDELRSILSDTKEIDPWLVTNFFQPLLDLQRTVGIRYQISAPPKHYREAREFAISLWECSDNDQMRQLVVQEAEGAAQLSYLLGVTVLQRQLSRPAQSTGIEPTYHKPFAALASRALEWLDEIEGNSPGRTESLE